MSDTEAFAAALRCDGCQCMIEVPLLPYQATVYIDLLQRREIDTAMDFLRQPNIYPSGWTARPDIVQRDVLFIDRRTGETQTSSTFVPASLDFCPQCSKNLLN